MGGGGEGGNEDEDRGRLPLVGTLYNSIVSEAVLDNIFTLM